MSRRESWSRPAGGGPDRVGAAAGEAGPHGHDAPDGPLAEQPAAVTDSVIQQQIDREVCKLAHRFIQQLDAHVRRAAEELGLTPTQVVALRELSDPITARELANRMACEASNATFVLDRLEQQGLIERQPHPTDRRAKQIVLTPAGERRRADVLERLSVYSPLAALSRTQQESLRDLLRALVT